MYLAYGMEIVPTGFAVVVSHCKTDLDPVVIGFGKIDSTAPDLGKNKLHIL